MRNQLAPLLALLSLGLLSGCLVGSETTQRQSGTYISAATMDQVQPGTSKEFVLALFGDPSSKTKIDEDEHLWKWEYREEKETDGSVFLLINTSKTTETRSAVYVVFADDVVQRVWRD